MLSLFYTSCSNHAQKNAQPTQEEIKADEIKNVGVKAYLAIGRPVIRPTVVEIEKDTKAIIDGYFIRFMVKNRATLTSYSNLRFDVVYVGQKGENLDKETISITKSLKPGDSIIVNQNLKRYRKTSYKVSFVSAKGE